MLDRDISWRLSLSDLGFYLTGNLVGTQIGGVSMQAHGATLIWPLTLLYLGNHNLGGS